MRMKKRKCDICGSTEYTDVHHIQSVSKQGTNKKYNKTNLCVSCHRKVHCSEIIIEGFFLTTSGNKLLWHNNKELSITGEQPDVYLF